MREGGDGGLVRVADQEDGAAVQQGHVLCSVEETGALRRPHPHAGQFVVASSFAVDSELEAPGKVHKDT